MCTATSRAHHNPVEYAIIIIIATSFRRMMQIQQNDKCIDGFLANDGFNRGKFEDGTRNRIGGGYWGLAVSFATICFEFSLFELDI